jgi:uncharacterized membrane-anchored protein
MNKNKRLQIISIFLPVLVMGAWIGSVALHRTSGNIARLRVVGFDPRDLLSGHYLRYQIDYGESPVTCQSADDWCLCLKVDQQGLARMEHQGRCSILPGCELRLRGQCQNERFTAGIERYYFSEEFRKELAVVPEQSSIEVSLDDQGNAIVKEFFVAEQKLIDWLKQNSK